MEFITDILYWITTGLLVPVIVTLMLLFLRALMLVGGFFGQYVAVKKSGGHTPLGLAYIDKMGKTNGDMAEARRLLAQFEMAADKELASSKMLSKLGPMLGLMGTLIPMGPALAGLSSGDIESMARNMQVAFATTVTGLVAAAIGYVTQQTKQRWYMKDLMELEFMSESTPGANNDNNKSR